QRSFHTFPQAIELRFDSPQLVAEGAVLQLQHVPPGVLPGVASTQLFQLKPEALIGDHELPPLGEHLLDDASAPSRGPREVPLARRIRRCGWALTRWRLGGAAGHSGRAQVETHAAGGAPSLPSDSAP